MRWAVVGLVYTSIEGRGGRRGEGRGGEGRRGDKSLKVIPQTSCFTTKLQENLVSSYHVSRMGSNDTLNTQPSGN